MKRHQIKSGVAILDYSPAGGVILQFEDEHIKGIVAPSYEALIRVLEEIQTKVKEIQRESDAIW